MKNYEIYHSLINERSLKLDEATERVRSEYRNRFKELEYTFTIENIEAIGFKKIGFYGAGNEYVYEKNGKKICVYRGDPTRVLLRSNLAVDFIHDLEELEDYANGIIYPDYKFYCYF